MVLTQRVGTEMQKVVSMICFHTTMVLTQQTQWKLTCSSAVKCFHTTMVLTQPEEMDRIKYEMLRRFHTTMVLTQPFSRLKFQYQTYWVSIPLWFLRNETPEQKKIRELEFPYHYGSYATGSTFFRESLTSLVSIPLWFLRNSPLAFFLLPLFLSFPLTPNGWTRS